jgi:hypothetical protein
MLSSPSFGSHHLCSDSILPNGEPVGDAGGLSSLPLTRFAFASPVSLITHWLAYMLDSLVRVSRRVIRNPFHQHQKIERGCSYYTPAWQPICTAFADATDFKLWRLYKHPLTRAGSVTTDDVSTYCSSARHLKFKETYKPPRSRFTASLENLVPFFLWRAKLMLIQVHLELPADARALRAPSQFYHLTLVTGLVWFPSNDFKFFWPPSQGPFHLSFTVLVCYRSCCNI